MTGTGTYRPTGDSRLYIRRILDAAQRVKDDIETKAEKLPAFPRMGRPGRVEGTRELVA